MKVMVWFYNHRDALDHLMHSTLIDSAEESGDNGAGANGVDNEETQLDQVGEIKLSRISLSLQCLVIKSAVDVSCQNLKPIDQHIVRVHCEAKKIIISYIICD